MNPTEARLTELQAELADHLVGLRQSQTDWSRKEQLLHQLDSAAVILKWVSVQLNSHASTSP